MSSTPPSSRIEAPTPLPETRGDENDVQHQPSLPHEPRGNDDIDDALEYRPTKKRKNTVGACDVRSTRKKKGKLSSALTLLPNEVMCEICSYLSPGDLLHVTQSSKVFAAFLLAPSSATVWRAARGLLGDSFPECPEDLTEQKYACLVFGTTCQRCGRPVRGLSCHVWILRRRWCDKCRVDIGSGQDPRYIPAAFTPTHLNSLLYIGVFRSAGKRWTHRIVEKTDVDEISLNEPKSDPDTVAGRAAQVVRRREHAQQLDAWVTKRADDRADELSELRSERINDLKEFLVKAGFERTLLDLLSPFVYRRQRTMKQSRRLKEKAWKAIEAEVTAGISEEIELMVARAPIVAHDMVVRHVERFCVERRPSIFFLPCGEVVARDPEVELAFESWAKGTEVVKQIITRSWSAPAIDLPPDLISLITRVIEGMQRDLHEYFSQALPLYKTLSEETSVNGMLDLATSVFTTDLPEKFTRPYWCMPYYLTYRIQDSMAHTTVYRQPHPDLKEGWVYDKVSAAIIKSIVLGCGLDIRTCTHAQLEEADPYVSCLTCHAEGLTYMMKWDQAHFHWRSTHRDTHESGGAWRVLDVKEKRTVRERWESTHPGNSQIRYECLVCPFIGPGHLALSNLENHLRISHNILDVSGPQYRVYSRQCRELAPITWNPSVYVPV